ncbi:DUF4064 domain-containing protein [Desmospora profundinema]|uniref:DUF4064 domain-containing protein n=1 Tax=Desmospora profundinema TaxID=1571184 RepID=A0ABU1IS03_9BACL|nr:DUF4064 domain-containing protein [Desmospora profundinema]MDR6226694.1 hypothetical protein [Desmospora profundinema]
MKRTAEFVLGLIGGILGAGAGLLVLAGGLFGQAYVDLMDEAETMAEIDATWITVVGGLLLLLSIASIVFSVPSMIRKNHVLSGIIQLVAGVGGFLLASFLWLIPGILMILSGALSFRKPKADSGGSAPQS